MISLFLSLIAYGAELPGEELYVAPLKSERVSVQMQNKEISPNKKQKSNALSIEPSNLPPEYLRKSGRQSTESSLIVPRGGLVEIFRGIKVGDMVETRVHHSIIAFPDEKAPVVAEVVSGRLRGLKFIGESYLEKNSKRIFINFSRVVQNGKVYPFNGIGLSEDGQPGLVGKYHSREAEYFTGDFISSFVAGYFDGLIPRRTGPFGQIEADSSIDSAVKKGLASGALSSAERFREKLKSTPVFSELSSDIYLIVLCL